MLRFWISILFLSFQISGNCQEPIEKVPFELAHNLIFIEVQINDSDKPLKFLFDTGAGVTVINTEISEKLSLNITDKSKINTSGKSLVSNESTPNRLKIGKKLILDNITLVIMDISHISNYFRFNVDGVIGYDLLKKVITETNIDEQKITFYETENFIYQGNAKATKLKTLESNLFGIEIEILPKKNKDSVKMNFQIDTGADNYLTFHNTSVQENKLINPKKRLKWRNGFGADSTLTKNIKSKINSVNFGGKKWKYIPVILEVDPINKRENTLADGLIGQSLLLDFNITYNLKEKLVYFEKRN